MYVNYSSMSVLRRIVVSSSIAAFCLAFGLLGVGLVLVLGVVAIVKNSADTRVTSPIGEFIGWITCVVIVGVIFGGGIALFIIKAYPIGLLIFSPLFGTIAYCIDSKICRGTMRTFSSEKSDVHMTNILSNEDGK